MLTMRDYRKALSIRDRYDMGSREWNLAQNKVTSIVTMLLADKNREMAQEIMDELASLNDCGVQADQEIVQLNIWLLEQNGFDKEASEAKGWDWK